MQGFPVLTRSAGFDDVTNKGDPTELGRWVGLGPGVNLDEVNREEKVLWKRQNYGNGRTRQSVQITSVSIESTASETDDPKRSSAYSTMQRYTIDWRAKHSALKQLYKNRRRKNRRKCRVLLLGYFLQLGFHQGEQSNAQARLN